MDQSFHCTDPLDTVVRVMDTARRMGLHLTGLRLSQERTGIFQVTASLADADPGQLATFAARLDQLADFRRVPGEGSDSCFCGSA